MSTQYHMNVHGEPAQCNAKNEESCPRTKQGSPHGDSPENVQEKNDALNRKLNFSTLSKAPKNDGLTKDQDRIYRAYRSVLKKIRGRPAANRRNDARKIVVDRYNVSFQELKQIIAMGDERDGVEHPQDKHYIARLKFTKEAEILENAYSEYSGCPRCKEEDAEDVRVRCDPYELKVNRSYVPMYSCYVCYMSTPSKK